MSAIQCLDKTEKYHLSNLRKKHSHLRPDIIYHSMPTTWKNKMIEQGFNYADSTIKEMTDLFETRVENLEPKEEMKKSSAAAKKSLKKIKKKKREYPDSSVIGPSEEKLAV